jgi:hypothetical protein
VSHEQPAKDFSRFRKAFSFRTHSHALSSSPAALKEDLPAPKIVTEDDIKLDVRLPRIRTSPNRKISRAPMTTPESNASSYLSSASGWELSTGHHLVKSAEQQTAHNLPKALSQPKWSVEPVAKEEDPEERGPNPQAIDFALLTCPPQAAPAEPTDQLNQLPITSETPSQEESCRLASDSFPTTTSSSKLEEGDPLATWQTLAAPAAPSSNPRKAAAIAPCQIHVRDPPPRFDDFRRRQGSVVEANEGGEEAENVGDEEGSRRLEKERLPQKVAPGSVQRPPPTPVMPIPRKSGEC